MGCPLTCRVGLAHAVYGGGCPEQAVSVAPSTAICSSSTAAWRRESRRAVYSMYLAHQ
ncbi:hypothetical protein CC78DRAFT_531687 [Lojkania enalia]|uniref:Uncharacterized protein n=1 Tax=Lojkania enalia TaxID=147567 RepID=A0A9P4N8S3_9PLEO|nr:hypothetical protein CC78DRAFT_531687 [Didymosphaeria enalia]